MKPIILIEDPKYSGNVGMVCRLIANQNLEPLRIIGKKMESKAEMEWMAYNSNFELEKIQYYETVLDAKKDLDILFGTGMRRGKNRGEFISLSQMDSKHTKDSKIGILFGREDKGLSNLAVDNTDYMIDFNLSSLQPSMNLSNSVAYFLGYYFNQENEKRKSIKSKLNLPTGFNSILESIFLKTNLSEFHNRKNLGMKRLKKIFENGIETNHDSNFLYKIFQKIDSSLGNKDEKNF